MDNFKNQLKQSLMEIPPELRYPVLIQLAILVRDELPKAKKEYDMAMIKNLIDLDGFFEMLKRKQEEEKDGTDLSGSRF